MRRNRWVVWGTVSLVGLVLVGLVFFRGRLLPPRGTYSLEVTYATLPPDDDALGRSLRGHDGWRDGTVTRSGNLITVQFSSDQPPSPATLREVLGECDRLGYGGRAHYRGGFFDRSQRGTSWQTFWVEYADLPANDEAVTKWLAGQPGVSRPTVWREGKVMAFEFELASPPPPTILADIMKKCEEGGYQGRVGYVSAFGRYR